MDDLIKDLYKPPFKYINGKIFDSEDNHVLDIRGWGRIQYMDDSETRQDKFGDYVAEILTKAYEKAIPAPEPSENG